MTTTVEPELLNPGSDPEVTRLKEEAMSAEQYAASLQVKSEDDYALVERELVRYKILEKEAKARFDPICQATDAAHKEACRQRNMVLGPIQSSIAILNNRAGRWLYDKQQREEQERRREIEAAQRAAEEKREQELLLAEANNATVDEVQALCDRPLEYAPVTTMPKRAATPVSLRKPTLKATVTNLPAFLNYVVQTQHSNLIVVHEGNLNRLINALGAAAKIPGVQITPVLTTATRTAQRRSS
jgi:hypothetical protein